jgi:hypothetical protein
VIENNPNKNLIVSMSIKQEFRQPKKKKRKRDHKIHVNSNEGSLKELKRCFKVFLYFFSIWIPYYKERHVDEVKIIKSSDFNSLANHPQTETPCRTMSSLTRESTIHSQRVLAGQCLVQSDNVQLPLGLCLDFESWPNN